MSLVPAVTDDHKLWVVIERMRLWIQAAEISVLCKVFGLSLRDRVRSSDIRWQLRVKLLVLCVERSQLRWLEHWIRMLPGHPWRFSWAYPAGGSVGVLGVDPDQEIDLMDG